MIWIRRLDIELNEMFEMIEREMISNIPEREEIWLEKWLLGEKKNKDGIHFSIFDGLDGALRLDWPELKYKHAICSSSCKNCRLKVSFGLKAHELVSKYLLNELTHTDMRYFSLIDSLFLSCLFFSPLRHSRLWVGVFLSTGNLNRKRGWLGNLRWPNT